ncbi:MAG: hypothetical protein Hals2KO_08340 [Halioglobus sp.]
MLATGQGISNKKFTKHEKFAEVISRYSNVQHGAQQREVRRLAQGCNSPADAGLVGQWRKIGS